MSDHPNATDYANKYQREAAYWRELCERMVAPNLDDSADAYFEAQAELARINAEALR